MNNQQTNSEKSPHKPCHNWISAQISAKHENLRHGSNQMKSTDNHATENIKIPHTIENLHEKCRSISDCGNRRSKRRLHSLRFHAGRPTVMGTAFRAWVPCSSSPRQFSDVGPPNPDLPATRKPLPVLRVPGCGQVVFPRHIPVPKGPLEDVHSSAGSDHGFRGFLDGLASPSAPRLITAALLFGAGGSLRAST